MATGSGGAVGRRSGPLAGTSEQLYQQVVVVLAPPALAAVRRPC